MSDTTTATEPRFPHIDVQLTGGDGNAFAVLGAVKRDRCDAIRRHATICSPPQWSG